MNGGLKILLLAGTAEARGVAKGLVQAGHQVVASLAGVTAAPKSLVVPTRRGGFGGRQAQRSYYHRIRFQAPRLPISLDH